MPIRVWRKCDCGYKDCKAKVMVTVHGEYVVIEYVTTTGEFGETFLTIEQAKLLLKDLEDAIRYIEERGK